MKKGNTVCDGDYGIIFLYRWLSNDGTSAVVLPKDSLEFADKSHYSTVITGENLALLTSEIPDVVNEMLEKCRKIHETLVMNPLEDLNRMFLINNISKDDILFMHVSPCNPCIPCKKECIVAITICLRQGFIIKYEKGEHCMDLIAVESTGVSH